MTIAGQTLEQLEGRIPETPALESYLVQRVRQLYRTPIGLFTVEDLRLMIGQGHGLSYLLPSALTRLESDPWAEGDFYEGDLLHAVLGIPEGFWRQHADQLRQTARIASAARVRIDELDTTDEIRSLLLSGMSHMQQLVAGAV
jgi:hypothetical protein